MQKLHDSLMGKNGAYAKWHSHPKHHTIQWLVLLLVVSSVAWLLVNRASQPQLASYGNTSLANQNKQTPSFNIHNPGPAQDHILVKFKDNISQARQTQAFASRGFSQRSEIPHIGFKLVNIPSGVTPEEAVKNMQADPNVLSAEEDGILTIQAIPNDPNYPSQWHLPQISAPAGWDISTGTPNVIIAVIDSGAEVTHPDLASKLVPGWNFLTGTSDTSPTHPHGTETAGTAAAIGNNATGVAGVAWNNEIMPLLVVDSSGSASMSNVASAVTYAADHGAKVINISLGGNGDYVALQSAVNYAWSKGLVIVAAAGNSASNAPMYPAAEQNVVAVSATCDTSNNLASFSSYGSDIDLAAPGCGILTTYPGSSYTSVSGTSFSSPITAGVAALMFSANPSLTNAQVVSLMESNADDLGAPGWDQYYGYGLVDAGKALAAAVGQVPKDTVPPSVPANLQAQASYLESKLQVNLTWSAASDNVGVLGYNIIRNGTQLATAPSASYIDTSVAPSTAYSYTVTAYDAAGNVSAASNTATVTTPAAAHSHLSLSPTAFSFSAVSGGATPDAQSLTLSNTGTAASNWSASADQSWCHVAPVSGTTAAGGNSTLSIYVDAPSNAGSFNCSLTVTDPAADNSPQTASVAYVVTAAVDTTPPSAPSNLTGSAVSPTQINLTWTASTDNVGVTGYNVIRNGSNIATVRETSYSDTSVLAGTSYSYTVTAYDAAGNVSAASNTATVTTPAVAHSHLSLSPTALSFSGVSGGATPEAKPLTLSNTGAADSNWSAVTNQIWCHVTPVSGSASAGGNSTLSVSVDAPSNVGSFSCNLNFTDPAADNSPQTATVAYAVTDGTPPSVPTNLSAAAVSSSQINLSWTASADNVGVMGYNVLRNGSKIAVVTGTSYNNTSLSAGTSYTYTVTAYDAAGNISAASNTATAVTPAAVVAVKITSPRVSSITANSVTIKWTTNIPSTGSVKYGKTRTALNSSKSDGLTSTSHSVTLTGLSRYTYYYYQIAALSQDGSSNAASSVSSFRTAWR